MIRILNIVSKRHGCLFLILLGFIGVSFLIPGLEAASFTDSVSVTSSGDNPSVDTDGNRVYVTYQDSTTPKFQKSSNRGLNWGSAVNVATVGYLPRIIMDNVLEAYVVYTGIGQTDYYWPWIRKSSGEGASFSTVMDGYSPSALAKAGLDASMQADIADAGNHMAVVYEDYYTSNAYRVGCLYSTDGTTWTNDGPIDTAGSASHIYPDVAMINNGTSNTAYVVWNDGGKLHFNSGTLGSFVGGGEAESNIGDNASQDVRGKPRIVATQIGASVYLFVVWSDYRSGRYDIYFNYSANGGTSWQASDQIFATSGEREHYQRDPVIAVKAGTTSVYTAWRDDRDMFDHIYFQQGELSGGSFRWGVDLDEDGDLSESSEQNIDIRVDDEAEGSIVSLDKPSIAAAGGQVYVVWHDSGGATKCSRYNQSEGYVTAPAAPTNLTATGGNGEVVLEWTKSSSVNVTYSMYRVLSTNRSNWASTATQAGIAGEAVTGSDTRLTYTDDNLTNGTAYFYILRAVNTLGSESSNSNLARATPHVVGEAPSEPRYLVANGGPVRMDLSWIEPSGASYYHVYRGTTSGGPYYYLAITENNYYTDESGTPGATYYYAATGFDSAETGYNNQSEDSNEASAIPLDAYGQLPPPPGGSQGEPSGGGCFIATAAYGTPFADEVKILSEFRNNFLLTNRSGRMLVNCYYKVSPAMANFISKRPYLKTLVRLELRPIVKIARLFCSYPDFGRGRKFEE